MRAVEGSWRQMTLPPLSFCLTQGQLDDLKFFGKPKLGLDAVGGMAAAKLADALVEVHMLLMSSACFGMFLERLPGLHRLTYGRHWSTPCTNALVLKSISTINAGWIDGVLWLCIWQVARMAVAVVGVPGAAGLWLQSAGLARKKPTQGAHRGMPFAPKHRSAWLCTNSLQQ